jgi:TPR repeat protein
VTSKAQLEADHEKAAATKKHAADVALKSNQDAAAKGDAYGLLRMGERYRDGEGVERDLAKAREYLQKSADAGSPTAADELSKLKP